MSSYGNSGGSNFSVEDSFFKKLAPPKGAYGIDDSNSSLEFLDGSGGSEFSIVSTKDFIPSPKQRARRARKGESSEGEHSRPAPIVPTPGWGAFQPKALSLCGSLFGGAQGGENKISLTHIRGGSYNRVVLVSVDGQGKYILRIPRNPNETDMAAEVAPFSFVAKHTPICSPEIVAYDCTPNNAIQSPYMVQALIPGQCLYPFWRNSATLTDSQRLRAARDLGQVYKQMLATRSPMAARILFPSGSASQNQEPHLVPFKTKYFAPWHLHSTESAIPYDAKFSRQTQSVAEFLVSLTQERILYFQQRYNRDDEQPTKSLLSLITAIRMMERSGLLSADHVPYTLYHWDIAARNLILRDPATAPDGQSSSLGVLDWDDCLFMPAFLTCNDIPKWLWQDISPIGKRTPSAVFSNMLKIEFFKAAGPEYAKYATSYGYKIVSEICKYLTRGMKHAEEHLELEEDRSGGTARYWAEQWRRWVQHQKLKVERK